MLKDLRYYLYQKKRKFREWVQGFHRRSLYINRKPGARKRLLLVKLDSIGDYLLFRNYLQAIRESEEFREYEVTLCGNLWWRDISEQHDKDWVHKFIWIDYTRLIDYDYNIRISRQLFSQAFDVAITPTYSRCRFTDELMLQSGAKVKIAHKGDAVNIDPELKNKNDRRYSRLVPVTDDLAFEFERNRAFFNVLMPSVRLPSLPYLSAEPSAEFDVVIAPGAKALFRQWAPEKFYSLASYLAGRYPGSRFCICGSAADRPLAEKIQKSGHDVTFTDITGRVGLDRLAQVMAGARLVLCNDSGPYHLAAALDIPLICISNGNHYRRFCPYPASYNKRHLEIFPPSLNAAFLNEESVLTLQTAGSAIDINEITAEQVIQAITQNSFLDAIGFHHHG